MGLYDTIKYKCPHCGKDEEVQTKLFHNALYVIDLGTKVSCPINFNIVNFFVRLKSPCMKCQKTAVMVVLKSRVADFIKPDKISTYFDSLDKVYLITEEHWGEYSYETLKGGFTTKW